MNVLRIENKVFRINILEIIDKLEKYKIQTRPIWYLNHLQKPFIKFQSYKISNSKTMFECCLCLPSSYGLKKNEQFKIINFLENKFKI